MEMGSDSSGGSAASGACGSSDSLNVLKFGQKIYFEDAGGGGSSSKGAAAASGSAGPAAPTMPPKKGKAAVGGGQQQPPRCQVEGCKLDLTGAKPYYCRHKVCAMHSKAPKVVVGGLEQRFCQQCSRFHQLSEFDQGKRSCRRRLAGHNERRRKPPPGPLSSRYGHLSSSFSDTSRFRSFLMDFTYPRLQGNAREVWPTVRASNRVATEQWQGSLGPPISIAGHGAHSNIQGPAGGSFFSAPEIPRGECLAGVSDSSCALSLLSNQTWGGNTAANQAPKISASSSFGGPPIAQPMAMNNYMTDSRGFRVHGDRDSQHEIQHQMGLEMVSEASNVQFSGELELALQGNGQSLDHGSGSSGRVYDQSGPMMHWSL